MDAEPAAPQIDVPVKVSEPEDKAPPSLAKPASGVVAEMSGALPTEPVAAPKPTDTAGMSYARQTQISLPLS